MKKIFFALALGMVCACLWAQSGTFVYDTVATRSRFSYSVGFRYSYEFGNVSADLQPYSRYTYHPVMGLTPMWLPNRTINAVAKWNGWSLAWQAEWKYFALDIAPAVYMSRVSGGNPGHDFWVGGSIQALAKFPVTDLFLPRDNRFYFSLLAGPEFMIRDGIGGYINWGGDLGIRATMHHILFLGFLAGVSMGPPAGGVKRSRFEEPDYYVERHSESTTWKFQWTLGIKTRTVEDVFYLKGKEVGHRRR